MRVLPILLALAFLAVLAPAQAQPPTFTQAYQVRGAVGDIPTTLAVEPSGTWNLEQRLAVQFSNSSQAQHSFAVPSGSSVVNASCTCNPSQFTVQSDSVLFTLPTSLPSGTYTLTVTTKQAADDAFAFTLRAPLAASQDQRVAILYVPHGKSYDAASKGSDPLPSTDGTADIVQFESLPSPFWVSIHPATTAAGSGDDGEGFEMEWLWAGLAGLLIGILVWAMLVQKGAVQRKGRKQVATTAAHVEAAASDPPAVLEGKKRALMAALKEVEVARMNNEMPVEVYDVVKADLKKQTVTVMRALEANSTNPPN